MPSRDPGQRLDDMLENILAIRSFTAGMDDQKFIEDKRTRYAVVRALEIISEASRRLPDDMKARHPEVEWPKLAALGNYYRHEYDVISDEIVWTTIERRLPILERVVRLELDRLERT